MIKNPHHTDTASTLCASKLYKPYTELCHAGFFTWPCTPELDNS